MRAAANASTTTLALAGWGGGELQTLYAVLGSGACAALKALALTGCPDLNPSQLADALVALPNLRSLTCVGPGGR